ncbi:hypothetical protein ACIRFH_15255 [Streptomyces sp. NPDC093586]|uniref:hypothetical protein n=1 Tax=Streptomyces sp. NPDC093586 TaxID=3366042 RepID=UPI00382A886A
MTTVTPTGRGMARILTAATLIPLASMCPLLTDAQRDGRACPWCDVSVTAETGIDLGERTLHRAAAIIHPVACQSCTSREALDAYVTHHRTCVKGTAAGLGDT